MSEDTTKGDNLPTAQPQQRPNPLARMNEGGVPALAGNAGAINAGAVAIEQQRAIADAKAKRLIAREYARDLYRATEAVREVCRIPEFADVAFYSVPRGNGTVTGDSIRMAEELARCWGNIWYGHREFSRDDKKSEIEVFAIDLETGTEATRQLTVMHVIDTTNGPKKCKSQKEIDDLINNKASKQRRGCILAVLPQWLREIARTECRNTLAGNNKVPIAQRVRDMVGAFAEYGVTVQMLELKLGHKLDMATQDDLVHLRGTYNALREGEPVSEHFGQDATVAGQSSAGASITAQARAAAATTPAAAPQAQAPAAAPAAAAHQEAAAPAASPAPARRAAPAAPRPTPAPTQPPAPPAEEPMDEPPPDIPPAGSSGDGDVF